MSTTGAVVPPAPARKPTPPSKPHRGLSLAEAERFLTAALDRAAEERRIAIVRFAAPAASIDAITSAVRKGTSIGWCAPDEPPLVAIGACATIALHGASRFADLEPAREALFDGALRLTHPSTEDRSPRLFGGWSFARGGADTEPWEGFGDGRFFLPRWTYESGAHAGVLTAAVDLRDGWDGRGHLARTELQTLFEALSRPAPSHHRASGLRVAHADPARYAAQIRDITEAIGAGELSKVVAARRAQVTADGDLDPWAVLHALRARYPDTWRFGLRFGHGTFVAATPERLFVKRGHRVEADALAGSIAAGARDAEARLHASAKDLREHTPVVDHIVARLEPLVEELHAHGQPRIRRLPNVLHLHTGIRGRLRAGVDAATLVETLHPTPAVGGVPVRAATRWIAEREPHPRGWYCGPVGWVDADGDAEFTVALRCGVVRGSSAWLWAGGGIVRGSEPEAEWNESALKFGPLLHSIGVS